MNKIIKIKGKEINLKNLFIFLAKKTRNNCKKWKMQK
jgi:hypothetical protein